MVEKYKMILKMSKNVMGISNKKQIRKTFVVPKMQFCSKKAPATTRRYNNRVLSKKTPAATRRYNNRGFK